MSTNNNIKATTITDLQTGETKTIEELFKFAGYTSVGSFIDETLQVGISDTPQTVKFGAGGTTSDGSLSVDSDGIITILKDKYLSIKQRFRAGRSGASGTSDLFFWAEISLDGGLSWSVIGNSVDIALENSSDTTVFFDLANIRLPAGVKLRNRFARSGDSDDSGDLRPLLPSTALQALDVPLAPSAQITVYTTD